MCLYIFFIYMKALKYFPVLKNAWKHFLISQTSVVRGIGSGLRNPAAGNCSRRLYTLYIVLLETGEKPRPVRLLRK